jgi:hypothetical protein
MAGLATAVMAVSAIVTNPAATPSPTLRLQNFSTPASASLKASVESWARDNGLAAPQIDARVASLSVGNLSVTGGAEIRGRSPPTGCLRRRAWRPHRGRLGVALSRAPHFPSPTRLSLIARASSSRW